MKLDTVGCMRRCIAFCKEQSIGFVVIGPEAPLVAGLGDALGAAGIKVLRADEGGGAARRLQGLYQGPAP